MALAVLLAGCAGKAEVPRPESQIRPEQATNFPTPTVADDQARARARTDLGIAYLRAGRYDIALEEGQLAIAHLSSHAPAHNLLALVFMALGKNDQAEAAFRQAIRFAPDNPEIANNYGWFLCQTGRIKESFTYFNQVLRNPLHRTPATVLHNMGICALMNNDDVAGEAFLFRALKLDPGMLRAYYLLADLDYRRGRFADARTWLKSLHERIQPTAETTWLALRIDRKLGDRKGEAAHHEILRGKFRDSPEHARLVRGEFD